MLWCHFLFVSCPFSPSSAAPCPTSPPTHQHTARSLTPHSSHSLYLWLVTMKPSSSAFAFPSLLGGVFSFWDSSGFGALVVEGGATGLYAMEPSVTFTGHNKPTHDTRGTRSQQDALSPVDPLTSPSFLQQRCFRIYLHGEQTNARQRIFLRPEATSSNNGCLCQPQVLGLCIRRNSDGPLSCLLPYEFSSCSCFRAAGRFSFCSGDKSFTVRP